MAPFHEAVSTFEKFSVLRGSYRQGGRVGKSFEIKFPQPMRLLLINRFYEANVCTKRAIKNSTLPQIQFAEDFQVIKKFKKKSETKKSI